MDDKAGVRSAVHPMLVMVPLGLAITAVLFDGLGLVTGSMRCLELSAYLVVAAFVFGVGAAVYRRADRKRAPSGVFGSPVRTALGGASLVLLGMSALLRLSSPTMPGLLPVLASLVATAVLLKLAPRLEATDVHKGRTVPGPRPSVLRRAQGSR